MPLPVSTTVKVQNKFYVRLSNLWHVQINRHPADEVAVPSWLQSDSSEIQTKWPGPNGVSYKYVQIYTDLYEWTQHVPIHNMTFEQNERPTSYSVNWFSGTYF